MVNKKAKQIGLMVFHDELNSFDLVTDVIHRTLGYHYTQAGNCANQVFYKGESLIKTFKIAEQEKAEYILQLIKDQGVPAKLIPL